MLVVEEAQSHGPMAVRMRHESCCSSTRQTRCPSSSAAPNERISSLRLPNPPLHETVQARREGCRVGGDLAVKDLLLLELWMVHVGE